MRAEVAERLMPPPAPGDTDGLISSDAVPPAEDGTWAAAVQRFAHTWVAPRVGEMDRHARLAPELLAELFARGLMAIETPTAYGGQGRSFTDAVAAIEEIARVCSGVAVAVDVHNLLVTSAVLRHGSGDQKRRFLPRLARQSLGAFALSEEHAGSDAFALQAEAVPDAAAYRLTGRKRWASNAAAAELFLVFARTGGDVGGRLSAFLLPRDSVGLSVAEGNDQIGVRAASTADVVLDEVRVRREDALGGVGRGELVAIDAFATGRVGIAAQLVGLARGALDAAVAYVGQRRQFGRSISEFQGVQFPLAAAAAEIEAARALTYRAARSVQTGQPQEEQLRLAAMAKYMASQVAQATASRAVDAFGGVGVVRGCPAEKFYRDARVGTIYEGTSNILLKTLASVLFHPSEAQT